MNMKIGVYCRDMGKLKKRSLGILAKVRKRSPSPLKKMKSCFKTDFKEHKGRGTGGF